MYELPYNRSGLEVLGHGYSSTVIREPESETVRKIIRGSNRLSGPGREALSEELGSRISANYVTHPDIAIPTSVVIAPSPIRGQPTVQLIQPFVNYNSGRPDPREIIDFAEKSLDEMLPSGYLPDIVGRQNLINTDEGIKLIDTVAVPADEPGIFGKCAARLYEMTRTGK